MNAKERRFAFRVKQQTGDPQARRKEMRSIIGSERDERRQIQEMLLLNEFLELKP